MGIHYFKASQTVHAPMDKVWDFFSSPANLKIITPPEMKFTIISEVSSEKIFPGQMIEYYVTPVWNMRVKWITKISDVRTNEFFSDEQLKGPYKCWEHKHFFKEIEGGIEMLDEVKYDIGYGMVGDKLLHSFIRRKIETIFSFRNKKITEIFPTQ
ncbi:MAG: SRPBCC family protein [Bacteroidota bacterium]